METVHLSIILVSGLILSLFWSNSKTLNTLIPLSMVLLVIWFIDKDLFFPVSLISLFGLFTKEIKHLLEIFGNKTLFFISPKSSTISNLEPIVEACFVLSGNKTGAIIVIKENDEVSTDSGISINGDLSSPLLISIFSETSPIHDGAVIIDGDKILQARSILPLSNREDLHYFGTRHRAGLGLSEICDAKVIVISEETGSVSLFHKKHFYQDLTMETLHQLLQIKSGI